MSRLKLFLAGISGWFHIVLFPVLISLIVSLIAFLSMPGFPGILLSTVVCICGLITGLVMATLIWKKRGSAYFLSKPEEPAAEEPEKDPESL